MQVSSNKNSSKDPVKNQLKNQNKQKKELAQLFKQKSKIESLDMDNIEQIQSILSGSLTKGQIKALISRLKNTSHLRYNHTSSFSSPIYSQPKKNLPASESNRIIYFNNLQKQLKSRLAILNSNESIKKCKRIFEIQSDQIKYQQNYQNLDRQIKKSSQQIALKKYYIKPSKKYLPPNKHNTMRQNSKGNTLTNFSNGNLDRKNVLTSAEKTRRHGTLRLINTYKNLGVDAVDGIKTCDVQSRVLSINQLFIKQNTFILKPYLQQEQLNHFQSQLLKKLIQIQQQYSFSCRYTQKIKQYTIFEHIIKKIFDLIQDDGKNIEIRQKFRESYRKIKEKMVQIVINQDEMLDSIKNNGIDENQRQFRVQLRRNKNKKPTKTFISFNKSNSIKYYGPDKDKEKLVDLNKQIEEALEQTKKQLKEAFIKRERPDFAYQLQLQFQNRISSHEGGRPGCLKINR